jgi:thiol:disulfide interchange protein DsbD
MARFARFLFGLGLGLLAQSAPALAQSGALPDVAPKVQASFIAEHAAVAPGGKVTVALRELIRENWHTYWVNPGDSGAPTVINWQLPEGWSAAAPQFPYPESIPVGPLMNFGYEKEVVLLNEITAPANATPGQTVTLEADVMWLVCSDVCIPEETHLSLPLPIAVDASPPAAEHAEMFADARAKLPHASPWTARYDATDTRFGLLLEAPELASARPKSAVFYAYTDGMVQPAAPQNAGTASDGLVINGAPGWKMTTAEKRSAVNSVKGILVLTGADGRVDALDLEAVPGPVPVAATALVGDSDMGLLTAMLFALLGGLILNLMPCVFPVLSMKALALAAKRDVPEAARASALAYGAGVLVSFVMLAALLIALQAGGAAVGWGFQLQQPLFVTVLALLMFAVGLNLSGLYEIGGGALAGAGEKLTHASGSAGSFFTGVLAVVVATPCTAPFMGAAMGYALTQNALFALAVFAALGIGFALPFVLLGFFPRALGFLPKPGAWMTNLRQILAFPMYGAAIWLIWVLSLQAGPDGLLVALASALALAFGLWALGRAQTSDGFGRRAGFATAAIAVLAAAGLTTYAGTFSAPAAVAPQVADASTIPYEPYTTARFEALRAEGRPVFINATAAWCITCLVNERVALSGDGLKNEFEQKKVAALKADWTNQNPEITALLKAQQRSGVPLYLYYAPGAQVPVVLPQILTESIVLAALKS